MSETTVELEYEITYTACELADKRVESLPKLRMYYDTNLVRTEQDGGIVTIHLDEDHLDKKYIGKLVARSDPRLDHKVPATACIGFAQYAQRRNEYGMACYTNAGTSHVKFHDILAKTSKNLPFECELPLRMENLRINGGEALEKGRIKLVVKSMRLGRRISLIKKEYCPLSAPVDNMESMLTEFISARMDEEAKIPDTWGEQTANVRAPMAIESMGIEFTQRCFLPVEAFAIKEPLVINVEYYQNALERQMARRNLSVKSDYALLDLAHKAELMADVCVYASQSFDYISDTVDRSNRMYDKTYDPRLRQGMEDFHNLGVTASGDCEDGGNLNQSMFSSFVMLKIDQKAYPELHEMQRIARNYISFLTLATVHGAKAEDNTEHIGAHMYLLWFPKTYTKQCLQTNPEGHEMAARLPLDVDAADTFVGGESLPVLFGEGTGRIRPLGTGPSPQTVSTIVKTHAARGLIGAEHPSSYDPLINARRYIGANMRTKGGLKTEIPHDRGAESPFYLGNLLVVTNEFLDLGYNIGAFTMCKIHPDGSLTRGAIFTDIINSNNNVALIPNKPVPAPLMHLMRACIAVRPPCMDFTLDKTKPMAGEATNPLLERMKKTINSMGRKGTAPYGSVDLFMRPHQFSSESIAYMTADIQKMSRVFKIDYQLEHITNSLCEYRVMLYVDEDSL